MAQESVESIRRAVLTQLHAARTAGRTPESIQISPHIYHHILVAFMHQLRISERGIELFGVLLVIEQDIAEISLAFV